MSRQIRQNKQEKIVKKICKFGKECKMFGCRNEHPEGLIKRPCNPYKCQYGEQCTGDHSPVNFPCRDDLDCDNKNCNFSHHVCDHDKCEDNNCLKFDFEFVEDNSKTKQATPANIESTVESAVEIVAKEVTKSVPNEIKSQNAKKSALSNNKFAALSEDVPKKKYVFSEIAKTNFKNNNKQEVINIKIEEKALCDQTNLTEYKIMINDLSAPIKINDSGLSGFDKIAHIGEVVSKMSKSEWNIKVKNDIISLTPKTDFTCTQRAIIPLKVKSKTLVETELEIDLPEGCDDFVRMYAISNKLKETTNPNEWTSSFDVKNNTVIVTKI